MTQKTHRQAYHSQHRRTLRRRFAQLPPAKKAELTIFAGIGLTACALVALLVY